MSVIIDFEIFQQMNDPSFIKNLKENTDSFYNNLQNTKIQVELLAKSLTLEFSFITYYF